MLFCYAGQSVIKYSVRITQHLIEKSECVCVCVCVCVCMCVCVYVYIYIYIYIYIKF